MMSFRQRHIHTFNVSIAKRFMQVQRTYTLQKAETIYNRLRLISLMSYIIGVLVLNHYAGWQVACGVFLVVLSLYLHTVSNKYKEIAIFIYDLPTD